MRVGRNLITDYYRANRKKTTVVGSRELEVMDFQDESDHCEPFDNLHQKERAERIEIDWILASCHHPIR